MEREDIILYIANNNGMINTDEVKKLNISLRNLQQQYFFIIQPCICIN